MELTRVKLKDLTTNTGQLEGVPSNPRLIKDNDFKNLKRSILVFPKMLEMRPVVMARYNALCIALGGNQRRAALQEISKMTLEQVGQELAGSREFQAKSDNERLDLLAYWQEWLESKDKPVTVYDASNLRPEEMSEFVIKDNVSFGDYDMDVLANEWDEEDLTDWGAKLSKDWSDTEKGIDNNDIYEHEYEEERDAKKLIDSFVSVPFSVLDTRQGYWKDRKNWWRELIQDNGESRTGTLGGSFMRVFSNGVSLLDPVLSEVLIKWFTPKENRNKCFDVFAGDSVFGYVSNYLENTFTGIELREEQVKLNNERIKSMESVYICDDGQNVLKHIAEDSQDFLFSCPPYFDLEVYSDLPNDASNQDDFDGFVKIMENAFTDAIKCLKENRFAAIVCGDVRDKKGDYRCLPDAIKKIFINAGMHFYNEMILVEPVGNLQMRVGAYMKNRKVGKCHQNVLIFYKGETKDIKNNFRDLRIEEYTDGGEDEQQ